MFPVKDTNINDNKEIIYSTVEQVFEIIEGVRKFKTDNKIRLGEDIKFVNIKGNKETLELIKAFKDDIQGVSRANQVNLIEESDFSFDFEALELVS
jgi:valyl-tRNA synthetase